jgi:hypothetical protein
VKRLGPISLPQDHPNAYSRQLSVMLYQYLRDIHEQINALQDEVAVTYYATRYDQDAATPTLAYLGKALVGSATSAAIWQIQKLVFGADGDVTITWADGNSAFDNIWDDRASLTYS